MAEEYVKGSGTGRGGWRGGGRPKGSKQTISKPKKEYVRTFYARCTSQEQYDKLKAYWQIIKD